VTHVLNCAATVSEVAAAAAGRPPVPAGCGLEWAGFAAQDSSEYELLPVHFAPSREWIDRARGAGGRVLVHCEQGVNRSARLRLARRRPGPA
jgi:hypothetical protein